MAKNTSKNKETEQPAEESGATNMANPTWENTLSKKIDFAVIFSVRNANPNGDPLNGNRPRINYDGHGEVSDVCLKRKIRNRLLTLGHAIFVQSDDNRNDGYRSLRQRAEGELGAEILKNESELRKQACDKWLDVRGFGQLFALQGDKKKKDKKVESSGDSEAEAGSDKKDEKGVSVGIRGPISIHPAFSIAPIEISSTQITKSVSGEGDGSKRGSDTMGMKHRVDRGIYYFFGSMNPQLATRTGFTDEDANKLKEAIKTLFDNDASSARPEGSMEVVEVYWWEHNNKHGQYSSAQVHRSLTITSKAEAPFYEIRESKLHDLKSTKLVNVH